MKTIILLLAVVITFTSSQEIRCPPEDPDNPGQTVYLPNPLDCHKYYVCSNGVPLSLDCPFPLVWDPTISACNSPGIYYCEETTTTEGPSSTAVASSTLTGSSTVAPSTVAGSSTVAPSTVVGSSTPAPSTVIGSSTAAPSTIAASSTVAPSTIAASSTVAPSTIAASSTVAASSTAPSTIAASTTPIIEPSEAPRRS